MNFQEYLYDVNHISGTKNIGADILSRITSLKYDDNEEENSDIINNWHEKLGHPGISTLYNTLKISGINIT